MGERVFKWPERILCVEENQPVSCHLSQITGKWTFKSLCLVFTEFTNVLRTILKQQGWDPCPLLLYMPFSPGGFKVAALRKPSPDLYSDHITLVRGGQEREG